jgi:hypothetical protein
MAEAVEMPDSWFIEEKTRETEKLRRAIDPGLA